MKEDILEQLVEDWFVSRPGFFTKHNIRYRPDKNDPDYDAQKDSASSDIDILAINAKAVIPVDRIHIVNCKSWQKGFTLSKWNEVFEAGINYNGNSSLHNWKRFRELTSDKWIKAFLDKIKEETGQVDLTYTIAVTKLHGTDQDRELFEKSDVVKERFLQKGSQIDLRILTLEEILNDYLQRIKDKGTNTLEATDVGRFLQLIHASGIKSFVLK